jgi:hypothetical protein
MHEKSAIDMKREANVWKETLVLEKRRQRQKWDVNVRNERCAGGNTRASKKAACTEIELRLWKESYMYEKSAG